MSKMPLWTASGHIENAEREAKRLGIDAA